ncbi:aminotransferase class V [Mycobacterium alsense]|uniref:Aminotransferase class V n=1 Tax=Mycobacterium alsense TaxID=324058 RepID=A0ABD6NZF1_9MYCO|nr:aminotransferase class V-fold PLP-dependent enzyme [Mycobacterium alsense]OBG32192.1 aminotransferase class V [Mycobacterium alsense]
MAREAFGARFVGAEGFLDTPTFGLPPHFTAEALCDCVRSWEEGRLQVRDFDEPIRASRAAYASLIGADEHRVAMGTSVSSAIGLVAAAIPDGSRVAAPRGEFTSVTYPFAAQAARGVTVTELPPGDLEDAAGDFDVVAASVVQSAHGAVLDVDKVRRSVAGSRTITVLDLSQALGWKDVALPWADVTVAPSYKWLLGPRGVAWMSLSRRMIDALTPHAANPYAAADMWTSLYGLPMRLAADARQFDASPAWFSVLGAGLSLVWLASLDRAAVQARTLELANLLRAELGLPPSESAIVAWPAGPAADGLRRAGIRASVRAGATRVGFHLYNTQEDLDRLVDALGRWRLA